MEATNVIVKTEFSPAEALASQMAQNLSGEDHAVLPKSLATEASAFVLVKSIPSHLNAWVILNAETRFSIGLVGMTVLPAIKSDKALQLASLEYSGMAYAEAFMYRSAQPLLTKYGMICSIVTTSPTPSIPEVSVAQPTIAIRDQSGSSSTHVSATLPPELPQARRTPALETSDDDCFIVSSWPLNPRDQTSSSTSKLSTSALSDCTSARPEPPDSAAGRMNSKSRIELPANPKIPDESLSGVSNSPASGTSTDQAASSMPEKNAHTSATITPAQQRYLLSGIQRLSKRQEATYFAQPLSFNQARLLNIPDYFDVIEKPMDLRTIE
ncbi:hypothetical protein MMC26_002226 [Xylographa opegraphella]|nr:hypothetical protein [Xylographa opegraphella]